MIDRRSKRSLYRSFSSRRFSSRGWKAEAAILWSSQGLALLGTSISQFTLIWWLTERTGSAIWLSVAAIGLLVPDVFILPFIGPIIDRYSRKRILIAANAAIAVVSAIGISLYPSFPFFFSRYISSDSPFLDPFSQSLFPIPFLDRSISDQFPM